MARGFPASQPAYAEEPSQNEWRALRGELVALLDQVETQVSAAGPDRPELAGLASRMRHLREQVGAAPPANRHREALRTVQRAVDRFSGQEEQVASPAAPPSRNSLESAINEIRARQANRVGEPAVRIPGPPERSLPQLDDMVRAVTGITGRLERLETELKSQRQGQGTIRDVAEQVAQLTHVVELLAGAVGETGQIKRLETQITAIAEMVTRGQQVDFSALTQRMDDVSATVERLADLQVQQATRERDVPADQAAMRKGMQAIEKSVRTVYDRIDVIERNFALSPADFEKLTAEMARFTGAMKEASQPQGLVEIADALNTRIGAIESRDSEVRRLKADIEDLREAVLGSVEPRFAALQSQLEALSDRMETRPAETVEVGQIEAQVRQLVARMDQTGEQLNGLARLYTQAEEREPAPDFEALAELVASRTSEALSRFEMPAAAPQRLTEDDFNGLEQRVSRLLSTANAGPDDQFSDMQEGIRRVDERLERLEAALTRMHTERAAQGPSATQPAPIAAPPAPPFRAIRDLAPDTRPEPEPRPEPVAAVPRSDAMPINPADERPLVEKPFAASAPILSALEAKSATRKLHPGLAAEPSEAPAATAARPPAPMPPPAFDPDSVERPARPTSSFDVPSREAFIEAVDAPQTPQVLAEPASVSVTASTRNTFVEAQRRAAQRHVPAKTGVGANSLLGRALARFQGTATPEKAAAPAPQADPKSETKPQSKAEPRSEPKLKATKQKPKRAPKAAPATDDEDGKSSFLTRHRQPILLAASVVALSFLTLNLINQRMASSRDEAPQGVEQTSPAAPTEPAPVSVTLEAPTTQLSSASTGPRVIPMVDSLATGSIAPAVPTAMALTSPADAMPAAITALSEIGDTVPADLDGPVKVELPPESLGPLELRQAAADGDARAQFEVAAIYTEGRAIAQDLAMAAIWYERAAAQGFAPAQYRLGNLYENGSGVEKDLEQARLWYQRAAEAGNRMSMHNLAALYAGGNLGKQEFASAAQWFEEAASRGMTDSQFNLGMLYARGLGVSQDMEVSFRWFALAALSGDEDAAKARDDIARSLAPDALARLNAEVEGWKAEAIDLPANFAPIGTWSPSFDPGPVIETREVVIGVQTLLNRLGYDVGTPDGIAGRRTAEAIRAFERATGMSEKGVVNPRLLAVLSSQPV